MSKGQRLGILMNHSDRIDSRLRIVLDEYNRSNFDKKVWNRVLMLHKASMIISKKMCNLLCQ